MNRARLNRRQYVAASAAAAALATPAAQALAQAIPAKFQEAPPVATLVKDRKLPAVEQRLPKEPVVLKPVDRVGQYGSSWRTVLLGTADGAWLTRVIYYDFLVRWDPDWKQVIPGLAKSWEASPDGTEYTFVLREGLKWSDGQPFTADDLVFWHRDVALNKTLTPVFPSWMTANKEPVQVEKLDQYTVKFAFPAPNGLFLQNMATPSGASLLVPAHYMKKWHLDYSKGEVEAAIAKDQLADWPALWNIKNSMQLNPERPVLNAWQAKNVLGEGTRITYERNPYYWKVDTAGNQLPYLDQVVFDLHETVETMVLKALNGEIDMQDRHVASDANKSVFFDNQQRGNYTFFETVGSSMNTAVISLNLVHKDPEKRQIFQDKRFRIALSHAINRQDAIDTLFVGQGEPAQPAPLRTSPFYYPRLTRQYTEYNPDLANQLLDEMGLTRRDSRGMRLRFDGQPLHIAFEVATISPAWIDYLQLVKRWWAAVGVDMDVVAEDRSLFYTRKEANEHDAAMWGGDGGLDVILEPRWYFPFSNESNYATPWAQWYFSDGVQGEEPPELTRQQMALYGQIRGTADEEEQRRLMLEILDIAAEQFYAIGLSAPARGYGIVRNDFHNVPKVMPGSWLYPNPGPVNPSQFFTSRRR